MADNKGRREEQMVFFVYDHNMLKKEEDDLKDAILYFSPEDVTADDQCALCGQLMGMTQYLSATLSKAAPQIYRFEHMKFALKKVGSYSMVLQGRGFLPDSLLKSQLNRLYETFVTFHGSLDSLRLRLKESHSEFVQELGNIWRTVLSVSNVSSHSLPSVFGALPYVHLPKNDAHLFLQATHLLQASQRRPYVMAGAILYKNGVLCTQLSPALTKQLTFLQNQMPHISRTTEFDLPIGCRIVTLFLKDKDVEQMCPLDYHAKRHCRGADFRMHRDTERTFNSASAGKNAKRRLTCPDLGSVAARAKAGEHVSDKALNNFLRNEHRKSNQLKQEAMGIEQIYWRKPKQDRLLSHVPIVECQSGESPIELDSGVLGDAAKESHFGQCYTEVDASRGETEKGEASETDDSKEDAKSQQSHHDVDTELAQNDIIVQSDTDLVENRGEAKEKPEEVLEPSISDLENNVDSDTENNAFTDNTDHGMVFSKPSQTDDVINYEDSGDMSQLSRNRVIDTTVLDSSVGNDERQNLNFSNSDDRTITLTQDSHHTILNHRVDVHAEESERTGDRVGSDGEGENDGHIKESFDSCFKSIKEGSHIVEQGTTEDDTDRDASNTLCDKLGTENVRGELEQSVDNVNEAITVTYPDKCDSKVEKTELDHNTDDLESSGQYITAQARQTTQTLTLSDDESGADLGETSKDTSKANTLTQTKLIDDKEKENLDPNKASLEVNIGDIEDSEIETEDERVNLKNENPCISCLELASEKGMAGKDKNNIRCSQCSEKLTSSLIFGKNHENQEVIDFREKSKDHDSGTETEDQERDTQSTVVHQNNGDARDTHEGFITSSFSSDVSTDSTISRYWTQEMDGLNDLTLYVQCHSDISLLLIMENPEKYQENVFHALWKGSLAQLADLDYYIKECLDTEEDENKAESYSYTRYDGFTNKLTGSMSASQEGSNENSHLHQMLTTLHAEFELHQCLSDVCLRSQFSSCYGHQNPVNETFFQINGQQKLMSGLPLPRDPLYGLEHTARSRLAKDRKLSMI